MHLTICIPTRDRDDSIQRTLRSLLASSYTDWDAVIVDQSRTDATERAVGALSQGDPRIRYVASTTRGSSAARNIALTFAQGPLVAFTDDDCEVASQWMERLVAYSLQNPESGLVYGAVLAGPHDPSAGFIPDYPITHFRRISSARLKWREGGIGANMASRLEVLRHVGGFDEVLGAGGQLHACLDGDLTYRVLKAGYVVLNVPDAVVIHHGFRTWQHGSRMMRRVGIGIGAAYMKHLRLGDLTVVPTLLIEWLRCISWGRMLFLRPRSGLARFLGYGLGIFLSFRYSIDPRTRVYLAPEVRQPDAALESDQLALIAPVGASQNAQPAGLHALWFHARWHVPPHLASPAIPMALPALLVLLLLVVAYFPPWGLASSHAQRPDTHTWDRHSRDRWVLA